MLNINNLNPQLILWIHQKRIDTISTKIAYLSFFCCLLNGGISFSLLFLQNIFKLSYLSSWDIDYQTNEILVIILFSLLTIILMILSITSYKLYSFSLILLFSDKTKKSLLISETLNVLSKLIPLIGLVVVIYGGMILKESICNFYYLFSIAIFLIGYLTLNIIDKFFSDKKSLTLSITESHLGLVKIAPKTWVKTRDAYLDTIDTIPDEINRWKKRNLKYVAYLVVAWDLLGFIRYFLKTLISNAISTRRVSS